MPKRVSYNSVKSTNKTLSQSKFRYLHLHKTPVFVLLSAAALKACGGGGGGSSGGGTQDGSVFELNKFSLVSVDPQSDNSYTISENSQPVLRGDDYYYLLGSVLEGTKIVNPDTPENNIYFALDSRELYLIHSQIIDFEAHSSHVYGITLEKSGISSALRFSPSDVPQDEEYKIHDAANNALSSVYKVDEVIEGGSNDVIAIFSVSSDTASVVLSLEGADKDDFDFNNRELIFKNAPDFETKSEYELILVSTQGGLFVQQNFKVSVLDVDEAPVITTPALDAFDENVAVGTSIVDLDASDDAGDVISWSIVSGNDEGLFAIDSDTGELVFDKSPDFETHGASRTLTIEASSTGSSNIEQTAEQVLTITINDVDELPVITTPALDTFDENVAVGTSIVDLDASDDAGDVISWSIVSGNDEGLFAIDSDTGELVFDKSPDFETHGASRTLTIRASSTGSSNIEQSAEQVLTITINDVDDAPVITSDVPDAFDENVAVGTSIVDLDASDDALDVITWSIVSGNDDGLFAIGSDTGELVFDKSPDFEELNGGTLNGDARAYALTIRASSIGSSGEVQTGALELTITINDKDEAPVIATPALDAFDENVEAGTSIVDLDASDPDDDYISWSIVSGNDEGLFAIDSSTGILSFKESPDFEIHGASRTLTIRASSTGSSGEVKTDSLELTITINDVDDAPVFTGEVVDPANNPQASNTVSDLTIQLNEEVEYDASALLLATISASDPDTPQDTVTLSLKPGSSVPAGFVFDFADDELSGELEIASSTITFDYEDENLFGLDDGGKVYSFTILATESDGISSELTVNIEIVDVDEAPVITSDVPDAFDENVEAGTSIVDLDASDGDGDTISWSIVSGNGGSLFDINSDTGELVFDKSPDFEIHGASRTLTIEASSTGSSNIEQTDSLELTITINDVDDAPVITRDKDTSTHDENVVDLYIATFTATDDDDDDISWSIVSGNDDSLFDINNLFTIDSSTGVLSFKESPDFEIHGAFRTLTIRASSTGSSNIEQTAKQEGFNVIINNVDDAPVITRDKDTSTHDENVVDLYIATFTATDDDGDDISWSISNNYNNLFTIDSSTGVLSFATSPNFEASSGTLNDAEDARTYALEIQASSGPSGEVQTDSLELTITITDEDETPVIVQPDSASTTFDENIAVGTSIVDLDASDPDDGDDISWSIKDDAYADLFTINSDGVLSFKESPNFETHGASRTLTIEASSTGSSGNLQIAEQVLTITINDVDELPVIATPTNTSFTYDESVVVGTSIVDLDVSDDAGDTITWSIFSGNDDDLFTIDSDTGALSFIALVVFAELSGGTLSQNANGYARTYALVIKASSSSSSGEVKIAEQSLSVTINDNEDKRPVIATPTKTSFTFDENVEVDTSIATFTATDENEDTITWSISGNDDSLFDINNLFTIDSSTGVLSFKESPNFEASSGTLNDAEDARTYALVIQASSTGFTVVEQTAEQVLTITINDVDEAPVIVQPDSATFTFDENIDIADVTYRVDLNDIIIDEDGDTITWSFIIGAEDSNYGDDFFAIGSDGVLFFSASPDFEELDSGTLSHNANGDVRTYVWKIKASSTGSSGEVQSAEQVLTIIINDKDEAPVITTPDPDTFTFRENIAAGTSIATLIATDDDGDDISWSISNNYNNLFTIDSSTGVLSFATSPNFEASSGTLNDAGNERTYALEIQASSGPSGEVQTDSLELTITITDEDETPVINTPALDAFDENIATLSITTLTAEDGAEDISWSIVSGNDEGLFAIDSDTGDLSFVTSPDFETHGAFHSLIIQASSSGGTATRSFDVTINDVNEPPIRNDKTEYLVSGNLNLADANSELVFDVSELISRFYDPEGDAINAIVFDTNSPDYGMFTITYNSDSDGSGSYVDLSNNTLTLADDDISDDTIKIVVKQGVSPEIGRKSLSYSVQDVVSMSLSPETLFGFEVTASGDQTPSFNVGLSEGIGNTDSSYNLLSNIITIKLNENQDYEALATISASDPDTPQDTVTLSLKDGIILPDGLSFDVLTGELKIASSTITFDYEDENLFGLDDGGKVYSFTILATESDDDDTSSELTVNIEIVDVDEAPVITSDVPDSASTTFDENIAAGTSIVDLDASDPDDGDDISWSIKDDAYADLFTINSDGVLSFKESPNFEASSGTLNDAEDARTYALVIQASSGPSENRQTAEQVLTITITDVNEAPTMRYTGVQAVPDLNLAVADSELIVNVSDLLLRFNDPENNINEIVFDDTISTDYDKFSIYHSADGSNYNLVTGNVVTLYEDNALASEIDVSDDTIKIVVKESSLPIAGFKLFFYSVRDFYDLSSPVGSAGLKFNVVDDSPQWSRGTGDYTLPLKPDGLGMVTLVLKGTPEKLLDFSDLSFSRELSTTANSDGSFDSTSITITIAESNVGEDDGGAITIGYTDFSFGYRINADILRIDANGDGNEVSTLHLLDERNFTAWDGNSDTPTVAGTDEAELIIGSSLRDKIEGGSGDDYIYALGGDDSLEGGVGDDTYYYSLGDGNDTIYEFSNKDDADVLILRGFSTNDLAGFGRYNGYSPEPTSNDLKIIFNDAAVSHITLINSFNNTQLGVDEIHFDTNSDGVKDAGETVWYDDDSLDATLTSFSEALDFTWGG